MWLEICLQFSQDMRFWGRDNCHYLEFFMVASALQRRSKCFTWPSWPRAAPKKGWEDMGSWALPTLPSLIFRGFSSSPLNLNGWVPKVLQMWQRLGDVGWFPYRTVCERKLSLGFIWFSNASYFLLDVPRGPRKVLTLLAITRKSQPGLLYSGFTQSDYHQGLPVHLHLRAESERGHRAGQKEQGHICVRPGLPLPWH